VLVGRGEISTTFCRRQLDPQPGELVQMDVLDVSRWQFGITTVYHFIFVRSRSGLAPLIAVMQTIWFVTGKQRLVPPHPFLREVVPDQLRHRRGTGIVQEFQFGMNWSEYSRFVGDIFGAPLARWKGLVAFFFESTFIGLWNLRLDPAAQGGCTWPASGSSRPRSTCRRSSSSAANSFMQHPVGATFNPTTGRAEPHQHRGAVHQQHRHRRVHPTPWRAHS